MICDTIPLEQHPDALSPMEEWHRAAEALEAAERARRSLPTLNVLIKNALVQGKYPGNLIQHRDALLHLCDEASDAIGFVELDLLQRANNHAIPCRP